MLPISAHFAVVLGSKEQNAGTWCHCNQTYTADLFTQTCWTMYPLMLRSKQSVALLALIVRICCWDHILSLGTACTPAFGSLRTHNSALLKYWTKARMNCSKLCYLAERQNNACATFPWQQHLGLTVVAHGWMGFDSNDKQNHFQLNRICLPDGVCYNNDLPRLTLCSDHAFGICIETCNMPQQYPKIENLNRRAEHGDHHLKQCTGMAQCAECHCRYSRLIAIVLSNNAISNWTTLTGSL